MTIGYRMAHTILGMASLTLLTGQLILAQPNMDHVEIKAEMVADHIYVLYGSGGNIGLAIGQEHAYLIDDQFAALTEKILAAVQNLTDKPIKYVVNTHWHGDHTGGNKNLAEQGVTIVAHNNVRERMSTFQQRGPGRVSQPQPYQALPEITFGKEMTIHLDSLQSMWIFHVGPSHTDGDSYIYFPESNVIHMGDNFPNGGYPFVDINAGGDIDGFVENINRALMLIDEDTKIIPGHGLVTDRSTLVAYRDMLDTIRLRVKKAKSDGKTLAEVQAMDLSAEWDEEFGNGFMKPSSMIKAVYETVDLGRD